MTKIDYNMVITWINLSKGPENCSVGWLMVGIIIISRKFYFA